MTLDISNSAYMLFMTIWILVTLYGVTFGIRALFIIESISRQALPSNNGKRGRR